MASAELELLVTLKDQASKALGTIGHNAEEAGRSGGILQSALGFVTGGAILSGLSAVASGIGTVFTDAYSGAKEAAQVMGQTEAVIKSTGGAAGVSAEHVADLAGALSDASGKSLFSGEQVQQSENLLLTFTNLRSGVLDAATAISVDMAQALGGAPKDSAIQLGKALNDPINGVTALTRVGVTFTDEQKAQIKAMQDAGDMAGAQQVILSELNKEFGGSAEAAAQADGGWAQFQARMGDAAKGIMTAMLPGLQQLGGVLNSPEVAGAIESAASLIGDGLGQAVQWLAQTALPWLTETALPALQGGFEAVWPLIQSAVNTVYTFLSGTVWPWLQNTAFPWLTNTALPAAQTAFETVWPIIQGAVNTVYTFLSQTVWPWLRDTAFPWIINTALPAVRGAFETAWPLIQGAISTVYTFMKDTVWPFLKTAFDNAKQYVSDLKTSWDTDIKLVKDIVQGIEDKVKTVRDNVSTAIDTLKGFFNAGWDTVKTTVQSTWDAIGGFISGPIETAKNAINTAIGLIKGWLQGAIDKVNELIDGYNSLPGTADLPHVPGGTRALGGPVFASTPYLVGERGPELFVPRQNGTIIPNTRLAAAAVRPGDTFIFQIDARGATPGIERQIETAVDRALQKVGYRADARLRSRG